MALLIIPWPERPAGGVRALGRPACVPARSVPPHVRLQIVLQIAVRPRNEQVVPPSDVARALGRNRPVTIRRYPWYDSTADFAGGDRWPLSSAT